MRRFCSVFVVTAAFGPQLLFAQEPAGTAPEMPVASLQPMIFETAGAHVWHRRDEVKYILLAGCGGGGNGGDSRRVPVSGGPPRVEPGKGGLASPIETFILPVTADKYDIVIGAGGQPTTLIGSDRSVTFVAGRGDELPDGVGGSGALGTGGTPRLLYGPGRAGNPATGNCAGGAGSGRDPNGGSGAPGYLAIAPLTDLDRFARVLGVIENFTEPATSADVPPDTPATDNAATSP